MRAFSVFAFVLATSAAAGGQTLGDVARQEAERRKAVGATGKVYTNDQLKPEPPSTAVVPRTPTTPGAPDAGAGKAEAGDASKAGGIKTEPGKGEGGKADATPAPNDEKAWRSKTQAVRDALTRAQTFAEALQSRINGLSADFTARDDPAQRAAVAADRQKSLDELERVKKEIQQHNKALSDIQDDARKAGVPAGWLR